jgi:hypothetical protein
MATSPTPSAVIREATTWSAFPRCGAWAVYDHWRDDADRFETAVYWLLAS